MKRPKKYDNMFPSSSDDSRNEESCLHRNMFGESNFDEGDGADKIIVKGNDIKFKQEIPLSKYELEQLAQEKLNEYQIIRMLGQGAYAQVKLAQHKKTK